jgi:hypothetical protein
LNWIVFLFSVGIMLSVNVERRVNVKFCVKLGKSATETYNLYVICTSPVLSLLPLAMLATLLYLYHKSSLSFSFLLSAINYSYFWFVMYSFNFSKVYWA